MFDSLKTKIFLGIYVFLILSIPVGAYFIQQRQSTSVSANNPLNRTITHIPDATPGAQKFSQSNQQTSTQSTNSETSVDTTLPSSFGPTLKLTLNLEGRPINKQVAKVFVGIAEGATSQNPKYLLTFNIDLPDSGVFQGLSLAGLTSGNKYTAYIKGPAQIVSASTFTMSSAETPLNSNQPILLYTGDLNEDNLINSQDYSILLSSFGSNTSSLNWNSLADFNLDGVINSFDLAILNKNLTKTGDSGVWTSPTPSTKSGSPTGGYWFWMPEI